MPVQQPGKAGAAARSGYRLLISACIDSRRSITRKGFALAGFGTFPAQRIHARGGQYNLTMWRLADSFLWRLPLGVLTAILIAWACALYCKPHSITRQFVVERSGAAGQRGWTWNDRTGFGIAWLWISEGVVREEPRDERRAPPNWVRIDQNAAVLGRDLYLAAGWPMVALVARENGTSLRAANPGRWTFGRAQPGTRWEWMYFISPSMTNDPYDARLLPLRPALPGFVVNAMVWTVAWIILITPLTRWRGARRARRGLCPDCKYDLRGCASDRCPECGRSIAKIRSTLPAPNPRA